jgi:hypothetical protein
MASRGSIGSKPSKPEGEIRSNTEKRSLTPTKRVETSKTIALAEKDLRWDARRSVVLASSPKTTVVEKTEVVEVTVTRSSSSSRVASAAKAAIHHEAGGLDPVRGKGAMATSGGAASGIVSTVTSSTVSRGSEKGRRSTSDSESDSDDPVSGRLSERNRATLSNVFSGYSSKSVPVKATHDVKSTPVTDEKPEPDTTSLHASVQSKLSDVFGQYSAKSSGSSDVKRHPSVEALRLAFMSPPFSRHRIGVNTAFGFPAGSDDAAFQALISASFIIPGPVVAGTPSKLSSNKLKLKPAAGLSSRHLADDSSPDWAVSVLNDIFESYARQRGDPSAPKDSEGWVRTKLVNVAIACSTSRKESTLSVPAVAGDVSTAQLATVPVAVTATPPHGPSSATSPLSVRFSPPHTSGSPPAQVSQHLKDVFGRYSSKQSPQRGNRRASAPDLSTSSDSDSSEGSTEVLARVDKLESENRQLQKQLDNTKQKLQATQSPEVRLSLD